MSEFFDALYERGLNNLYKRGEVKEDKGDYRYNEPKKAPNATSEQAKEVIEQNDIYREAKERILDAQIGQVSYGIDKYPEALNQDSWSMIESIDHIIDESIDKLHYLVMLKMQLERELKNEGVKRRRGSYEYYPDDN